MLETVVACCLEEFSRDYPETMMAIVENQYFVTAIDEIKEKKYASGMAESETRRIYFVDFTKPLVLDEAEFQKESYKLYEEFKQVPKWYET